MFTGSYRHGEFRPLSPEVSRPRAQARLRSRRRWFSFKAEPLRLELIRLPVYIVEACLSPPEGGDPVAVRLAVDGLNGTVERLDRSVTLNSVAAEGAVPSPVVKNVGGRTSAEERRRKNVGAPPVVASTPEWTVVPPNLSREEALSRARTELPWLSLHFALRRGVVYSLAAMDVSDRVGYPYWILHTVRRQRRDFRALDGISGKRLGSRGRSLVVQGYILLAKQEGGE